MNIKSCFIRLSIVLLCIILIFYTINIERFADYYPPLTKGACSTSRGPSFYPKLKSFKKNTEDECKVLCDNDPLCDAYSYDKSNTSNNCLLFNTNYTAAGYNRDPNEPKNPNDPTDVRTLDSSLLDIVQKSTSDFINGWNCNIKIKKYRYYKWVITDVRTIGSQIEVGKIYFYDKNKQLINNPNLKIITVPNSDSPSTNKAENLILYDSNNSWIDNKGVYDPERAGPSKAPTNNNGGLVYFDFGENYINLPRVEYFDWRTSTNNNGRDPIWWSFFGTNEDITVSNKAYLTDIYNNKIKWDLLHYQDIYILSNFNTDLIYDYNGRLNVLKNAIPTARNASASNGNLFELTYPNCSCTKAPAPIRTNPPCTVNDKFDTISTNLSSVKENLNKIKTYYDTLNNKVNMFFNNDVINILDTIKTNNVTGLNNILSKVNSDKNALDTFLNQNPNIGLNYTASSTQSTPSIQPTTSTTSTTSTPSTTPTSTRR